MPPSEPRDWATEEAENIARQILGTANITANLTVAVEWLAAKLRLIKTEGRGEGLEMASRAMDEIVKRKSA